MNDVLFDLVEQRLDGEIDDHAWQDALAQHGTELEQLLLEEQHIRQAVQALPRPALPTALQTQLQQIGANVSDRNTNEQTAPRTLLFPILNTIAAVAAGIAVVAMAFILQAQPNSAEAEHLAMHDHQADERNELEMSEGGKGTGARKSNDEPIAADKDIATNSAPHDHQPSNLKQQRRSLGAASESPDFAADDMSDRIAIEELETDVAADAKTKETSSAELKPGQHSEQTVTASSAFAAPQEPAASKYEKKSNEAVEQQSLVIADGSIQGAQHMGGIARSKRTDSERNRDAGQQSDALAPLAEQDMQAVLDEARQNVQSNQKVRDAVADQAKNDGVPQGAALAKQRAVLNEALSVEEALHKELDPQQAPQLNLRLGIQKKSDHLSLNIEMDDIDTQWFKQAILKMKLLGLDENNSVQWQSPIKTHQINADIIELRSDGLPPQHVKQVVLESLGQRSAPVSVPSAE